MTDTILTGQSPNHDETDGNSSRNVGQRFQTSASGKVVASGRVWVPAEGLGSTALYQIWDTTGPTKLAEVDLNSLSPPTSGTWMNVPLSSPVSLTASHNYIVSFYMNGASYYVWKTSESYPVGSGGTVTSDTSIFKNNGTSSQAPDDTTFTGGLFFTDVNVTDSGITVNVGTAAEVDSALSITPAQSVDVGTAAEVDSALSVLAIAVVTVDIAREFDRALSMGNFALGIGDDLSPTYLANRLAGTLEHDVPTLTMQAALVKWAGDNPDISYIEALNEKVPSLLPHWLALQGVLNRLAGTKDLAPQGALNEM